MHIVRALPPAYGEATAKVCDERSDQGVGHEITCDTAMTGIVSDEHDLLL
jgi:hypothetical protein